MLTLNAAGYLGRNASSKEVNGSTVTTFPVAARTGKDDTTWIDCSLWGKRGEALKQYLTKGTAVTIVGGMKVRTSKQGAVYIDCNVSEIALLGDGKPKQDQPQQQRKPKPRPAKKADNGRKGFQAPPEQDGVVEDFNDPLPF